MTSKSARLLPLNSNEIAGLIPYSKNTLYHWHTDGKYPQIFVCIGRKVLINLDEWEKITQKAVEESQKKYQKIRRLDYANR